MNAYLQTIVQDDFLWRAISERIAGQGAKARTNFINIRCPICNDYKRRCGIKNDSAIIVSCYNCGFKTGWSLGSSLGTKMRSFMLAIGITDTEISKLNYRALSYRNIVQSSPEAALYITGHATPSFDTMALPTGSKSFRTLLADGCSDPDFLAAKAYMDGRGEEVAESYDYYWSPSTDHQTNRRVIIPLLFEGRTVGYSARAIDAENNQRYQMRAPQNFLFNAAALIDPDRPFIILAEGILDAIVLDCVGTLGAHLNAEQIAWIKGYNKKVIMLADRDKQGAAMIDVALAQNWHVSFPVGGARSWWEPDVKDAAEAAKRYGKLWTLTSVIEEATDNKMKINFMRKKLII